MSGTINVILDHRSPGLVEESMERWKKREDGEAVLLVFGGREADFDVAKFSPKVLAKGDAHRTRDHQRERQSYAGVFRAAADWIAGECPGAEFVHFIEYDVCPLVPDWNGRLVEAAKAERADALFPRLRRVDGTGNPIFLSHAHGQEFGAYWREFSRREEAEVVLTALGSHSFWRREVFEEVSRLEGGEDIYLELFLPTAAHHLGFRVRPMPPSQTGFILPKGEWSAEAREQAKTAGAWAVHPVKGG